jgi:hypothetical protein
VTATIQEAPDENKVADYLADRLSDAEAQAFELYCLEHPVFARHVEQELALKTGMRAIRESGDKPLAAAKRNISRWPLALAASVVILIAAGLLFQYSARQHPRLVAFRSAAELTDQLKHAAVSEVRLARTRGQTTLTQVSVSDRGIVDIQVLPDFASETGAYTIKMAAEAAGSTQSLLVRDLKPTGDGYLQIYVPAGPLIGRTWLLSVGDGEHAEAFRLEFTGAPAAAP